LASQAIMLTLAGVPGIYVHSLFGSRNCHTCVEETGRARSINREKFQREALEAFLADPESLGARVYNGYAQLLTIRRQHQAFHPQGEQQILSLDKRVFAVLRTAPDRSEQILCLTNVTDQTVRLRLAPSGALPRATQWHDLFSDVNVDIPADIELPPYQVFWLLRA
jgi:sucrose phosphorylase